MIQLHQLPWGLTATLLAATALHAPRVAAVPSVNVAMKAAFSAPPYLIELLETAAQESPTSYFPLLDRIADGHFSGAKTDKETYEKFLDVLQEDGHLVGAESLSTFKLALSLRSAAPRIEAHYQYYSTAVEPKLTWSQEGCSHWVHTRFEQYCDAEVASPQGTMFANADAKPLAFDTSLGSGPAMVLYTDITAPDFGKYHKALVARARKGEITYRLRHRRSPDAVLEPLPVNGYGVELALKRTDYIVIDDRESGEEDTQKVMAADVALDAEEEVSDLRAMSKSELSRLGVKAANFILKNANPFDALLKLTRDFPKFSTSIATHEESKDFARESRANRETQGVPAGMNVLWMNGVQLIERQIQAFTLVDIVRKERKLISAVRDLGLTAKEAVDVWGHPEVASSKAGGDAQRFDWRDQAEEGRVIIWLNDIERDSRYKEYSPELFGLLRGGGGQIPPVRRDIFNAVFAVDLAKPEDMEFIVGNLMTLIQRRLPVRFGIVPLASSPDSIEQAKVAYHLLESYGLGAMTAYLKTASEAAKDGKVNEAAFTDALKDRQVRSKGTKMSLNEVFSSEQHETQLQLAKKWAGRLGANSVLPPIFVDGLAVTRNDDWLQSLSSAILGDLQQLQQAIYFGMVDENMWVPEFFLQHAAARRNEYVFPEGGAEPTIFDVNKLYTENAALFELVPVIEASEDSSKETWAALTVAADLTSEAGLALLYSAVQFRQNNPGVRVDVVHNSAKGDAASINQHLRGQTERLSAVETLEELTKLVQAASSVEGDSKEYPAHLIKFLTSTGVASDESVLILNGRLVGPIKSTFNEDDFLTLLDFEQTNRILPVFKAVEELGLVDKVTSPLGSAKLSSITALSTISDLPEGIFDKAPTLRITDFNRWNSSHTAFEVGDAATASIHFAALLDPASEQGQRWAPILKVLSELEGVHMKIFLNPQEKLSELPVKRFYRSVLASAPSFDDAGKVQALSAEFKNLPSEALLNLGMEVPPAWLVTPKATVHDPDNIKLSTIKSNVDATYELEHILIEGHSREANGQAPRGLQLVLGTESEPHFADTLVMANLGFFQFKANPGYYNIQLLEGRSSEIFYIDSIGAGGMKDTSEEGTEVSLIDFQGTTLYPRLLRKAGMEKEDVLGNEADEPKGDSGMVAKGLKFAESLFGGSKSADKAVVKTSDQEHAEINIFSVASGHLYERMLNIMMVSVMKHTNHTVKFWFIEQFLSPSFKDFIPHLAQEYGFKYEMVTYKWPHWLRQQKEKQREIWGYKILFLDVLFPLSLDKVIFVDADQIVRTDMYELVTHDLQGAVYGFTPMCDSRTEMEGFRFWKQGYWANYLKGLPYHISALYAVDLRRFRQIAAGDRLRQTYHQLSADPGSLANLDQDLPNHMQFTLPIHSLPQEWLWCETWCSDESLKEAKTIDLCNNPQTKEPKLDRARRQVPEWTEYDDEIAALDRRRRGLNGNGKKVEDGEKNTKSRKLEHVKTREKDEL